MKKKLFMICLLGLVSGINLQAGVVVDDPIEKDQDNNDKGGRTITPTCELAVNGDILNINVSHYIGSVQVTVMGTSYYSVFNNNISSACSCLSLNFEGFAKEVYTLIVNLQDGTTYRAVVHVE